MSDAAALHTDLYNTVVSLCRFHHAPSFPDIVTGRLLHIHVLTRLAGPHSSQGVPVIAGNYSHRIDLFIIQQLSDILKGFGLTFADLLCQLDALFQAALVDVAHGGDPAVRLAGEHRQHLAAPSSQPDDGDVQHLVGTARNAGCQCGGTTLHEQSSIHRPLLKVPQMPHWIAAPESRSGPCGFARSP